MASTAFPTLRQRWASRYMATKYPIRGTATGGSTTTVVDSSAALSGATTDTYDNWWVKITTTTDGAAPQGEVRQISEGGYTAASGTFTVPSAFSAAVGAGDTYEMHRDFHPSEIDVIANEKLRNLWVPTLFPLTAHLLTNDDNDMESTATITGMWTASSATQTKATSPIYGGGQVLSVEATGTPGYSRPASNLNVDPDLQYATAVLCALTDGDSAKLTLTDVTNTATIDETDAVTLTDWQELYLQWSPPSTCRQVQPRLTSVTSGDISFWDEYHTWVVGHYTYNLPTWATMRQQVVDVRGFPLSGGGGDSYNASERRSVPLRWGFEREDWAGSQEVKVWVDVPGNIRPYLVLRKPVIEVSFDYGTAGTGTTANTVPLTSQQADIVVWGIYAEACRRVSNLYDGDVRKHYEREAYRADAKYRAGVHAMGLGEPVVRHQPSRVAAVIR